MQKPVYPIYKSFLFVFGKFELSRFLLNGAVYTALVSFAPAISVAKNRNSLLSISADASDCLQVVTQVESDYRCEFRGKAFLTCELRHRNDI